MTTKHTTADVLAELRKSIEAMGLRGFCRAVKADPGYVSAVNNGKKPLSPSLAEALGFTKLPDMYVRREK
jgi:hypothetical protein